jgi:hypothetical protein
MPRPHHGGGPEPPPHRPGGGSDPPGEPRRHHTPTGGDVGGVAGAERAVAQTFERGRPGADDLELKRWEQTRDRLGSEPPKVNVGYHDVRHEFNKAHTDRDHGPTIPLRRDPSVKTIEGRIYGDEGWPRPANGSFRWSDPSTMNRTINDYVSRNWERIRNNLAIAGEHEDVFDAGHRVGEGFVNRGMYGAGPRVAQYGTTSVVRIVIHLVPGSDPPEPFILTAFPTALG